MAWPKGVPRKPRKPSPVPLAAAPQIEWSTEMEQFGRLMIVVSMNGKELERWNPNPRYLWRECLERQERHAGV